MKGIAWLLSLALLAGAFAGCAGEQAYVPTGDGLADYTRPQDETTAPNVTAPGGLNNPEEGYTLAYYPEAGFNPYTCTNIHNRMLFSLLYQSLFTVASDYTVEPQLCESYSVSADLSTYIIKLANASFPDGTMITAADVVESLDRAKESDYYGARFKHIKKVEATDGNTITIQTKLPLEQLPLLLDIPIVRAGQTKAERPEGTGPYVLTGEGPLVLQRRGNWWCSVKLPIDEDAIELMKGEKNTQIRDEFEFGDLGISTADPGSPNYAAYRGDYELWDAETGAFLFLGCSSASPVFGQLQVRVALSYAIDRTAILADCYNGFGAAATLPASPYSPFYDRNLAKQVSYNPTVLTNALQEAELTGKTVRLLVNKEDSIRLKAARQVARMLTDCGLVVELLEYTYQDFRVVLRSPSRYDLYLGQTKLSPNMDISEFFRSGGSLSSGGMANESCYALCKEALENSGNFYNLHQMVLRNGQLIPILFRANAVCAERGVADDMNPSRDNVFYYSMGRTLESARIEAPSDAENDE